MFDRDVKTIGKHIANAIKEELANEVVVAKFATVQIEGTREVERSIEYYNLDAVISADLIIVKKGTSKGSAN